MHACQQGGFDINISRLGQEMNLRSLEAVIKRDVHDGVDVKVCACACACKGRACACTDDSWECCRVCVHA